MAHALDTEEGQPPTKGGDASTSKTQNGDNATAQWLDKNNLAHLKTVFAKESITIEEILNMNDNEQIEFIDLLADDANVQFNKRDSMRFKSKLKSERTQNIPHSQPQYQQVIITEAEQSAFKSLTDKYQELQQEQKEMEGIIGELESEHTKQKEIVNDVFDEITARVLKRKNVLLDKMSTMMISYKAQLTVKREQNASFRNELLKAQKQYDENLKQSAKPASSAFSTGFVNIQQRANANVKLIDEILLQTEHENDPQTELKPAIITFTINKPHIMQSIDLWGNIQMNNDHKEEIDNKLSAQKINLKMDIDQTDNKLSTKVPQIGVLWKRNYTTAIVEILMNDDSEQRPKKYTLQICDGNTRCDINSVSETYLKDLALKTITDIEILENGIAFHRIEGLECEHKYYVRARAVYIGHNNVDIAYDEFSAWSSIVTNKPKKRKKRKFNEKVEAFWKANFSNFGGSISYNEWLNKTQNIYFGLDQYERKRIYFGINYPQCRGQMILQRFETFVSSNDVHSSNRDWLQFRKKLRDVVLK